MGVKGRKSNGSGRPSETRQLAVKGEQSPPKMPRDMKGKFARELWELAVESLPHVLRPVDGPILRLCCEAYQSAMENAGSDEPEKHKMFCAAVTKFDSLAKQLGLTPHCRRVIKPVTPDQEESEDPNLIRLLRGGLN